VLKVDRSGNAAQVPYVDSDWRLIDRRRTPTSGGRSLKDDGPVSTTYDSRNEASVICGTGQSAGQPCPAIGQFETTAGQWCNHAKRCRRTASIPPPPEVALRQTQRLDYSADPRNYFYDVAGGNANGEFTTFIEWDATGNDVMTVDRCHGDESRGTVSSEHVYEMAA